MIFKPFKPIPTFGKAVFIPIGWYWVENLDVDQREFYGF